MHHHEILDTVPKYAQSHFVRISLIEQDPRIMLFWGRTCSTISSRYRHSNTRIPLGTVGECATQHERFFTSSQSILHPPPSTHTFIRQRHSCRHTVLYIGCGVLRGQAHPKSARPRNLPLHPPKSNLDLAFPLLSPVFRANMLFKW